MAHLDRETRTLIGRLAYFGPAAGGKTTNLEAVFHSVPVAQRGRVAAVGAPGERVVAYDCRPRDAGIVPGWDTRLRVCAAPGTPSEHALKRLLAGVDGVIFVVDSQPERVRESVHARDALFGLLREQDDDPNAVPIVYQWNKRDAPGAYPVDELNLLFNPDGNPSYSATATRAEGVIPTFEHLCRMVVAQLRFQYGRGRSDASDLSRAIVIPEQRRRRTQRLEGRDLSKTLELSSPDLPVPAAPEGEAAADLSGEGIGPYRVISELGRDGLSVAYRALDADGREVALKVITEGAARVPDALERFQRTSVLLTKFRHPGVVEVLGAGVHADQPYVAYALDAGTRPFDQVFSTLPVGARVKLVRDAARALGAAHGQGLVHRNVKPANLLVDASGAVKVADFGLTTAMSVDLSKSGAFEAKPTHMAPEQLNGADYKVGPATDVWALGVTLYEALTGQLPFRSTRVVELIPEILRGDPPPPTSLRPELSPTVEAICMRALGRAPAHRYPDAAALAAELDWELESLLEADSQVASEEPSHPFELPASELPQDADLAAGVRAAAGDPKQRVGRTVLLTEVDRSELGTLVRAWDRDSTQLMLVRVVDGVGRLDDRVYAQLEELTRVRSSGLSLRSFGMTEDGRLYLVTDGVAGRTLAARRRSPKRTVVVIRDVARSLASVADAGVLHGGIHPGCVLIDKTFGRGHLIDFGLAPALRSLAQGPKLPGRYRPPECFSRAAAGDARSDVYALGAVLYFGLTGQPPGTGELAPPSTLAPKHVPKTLDTLCLKALRDSPDARYQSAAELAAALERFLDRFANSPNASG